MWSTRQLADLTGTTLRTIRHWHSVGLMPEPERASNGYKQYTATHLVLALRIKRLTTLGFSLAQTARMLADTETGAESLRDLRAEITTRIEELERLRSEVDQLIEFGGDPDLSLDALTAARAFGDDQVSRDTAIVLAHLYPGEETVELARTMLAAPPEMRSVNDAMMALPDDASQDEIDQLAQRAVAAIVATVPDIAGPIPAMEGAKADAVNAVATERLNPAQREVMRRVVRRLSEDLT